MPYVALALPGTMLARKSEVVPFSICSGFAIRYEVDSEDALQMMPGRSKLVQKESPGVRAENFIVNIHHQFFVTFNNLIS